MAQDRDDIDLGALIAGDKRQWDAFCLAYSPIIRAAAYRALGRADRDDVLDAAQETFVRLCRDRFRLLREFDARRAKLSTWLAVIAHSAAIDWIRRKRPMVNIDDVGEAHLAVEDRHIEKIAIPDGLLSPRQALVMTMLYQREMEVSEIAVFLGIDPQTVRSLHHKALSKLRQHFNGDEPPATAV